MEYKKVIEKLANDVLEKYAEFGEEITDKMVSDFVEDKRDYLENYNEFDYERDVMDKIQEIGQLEIEQKPEQNTKEMDKEQTETGQEIDEKETETDDEDKDIEDGEIEEILEKTKTPLFEQKTDQQGTLWDFSCNASMLKTLCKKALAINNEVPLYIRKDGIQIKTVDPSHVSMVDIKIPRKDFYTGNTCINKEVHYNLQEDLDIGIDLNKLERTLKLFDNSDRVNGYIENNKLNLISEYNDKILHKRISLLDTAGMTETKIPDMEFDIKAEVKSSEFATLKKALEDEDYVVFIAKEDLRAIIENDEDDLTMTLSKKDDVKGTGKALYSSDYLKNIIDVFGGGFYYNIDVAFSTDSPIKFEGKIADTGTYTYLLAPRIEAT